MSLIMTAGAYGKLLDSPIGSSLFTNRNEIMLLSRTTLTNKQKFRNHFHIDERALCHASKTSFSFLPGFVAVFLK
jgi:hypothetical protein